MGLVTCCMVNMTNQSALLKLALLLLLAYGTDARMQIVSPKQDVLVGEVILLLCKAGGEGTITWQKDEEDIDDEEKVSGIDETSSKLSIKKATMNDAGKYSCLCDFDNGHQDKIDVQLYIYEGPSFGSKKTYHEFLEGTDGMVPCLVTGKPEVDVHWLRGNQNIPSDGRTNTQGLMGVVRTKCD